MKYSPTLILMLISFSLFAEVKIDIAFDSTFYEGSPIAGTLMVSHSKTEKIDPHSFMLQNKPLIVKFLKDVPMPGNGNFLISSYHFSLPAEQKGPHMFPSISVSVDGTIYRSIATTYEVKAIDATGTTVTEKKKEGDVQFFLKLEAFVNGSTDIYPGQRTTVGYRYIYNTSIETKQEATPLLDAIGLVKIGDKVVKQEESDGITVQQIEQTVEGKNIGDYQFGPSFIEGIPYTTDASGKRVYSYKQIHAAAPNITIHVKPFPEKDKPPSFNGAVGDFTWDVKLNSPSTVNIGDEVELAITAKGKGNFDSVNLPETCCQPGLSGLFSMNNLPPVGKMIGVDKQFILKLKPLTWHVKSIPSLEFSSFNPKTATYNTFHSDPIPLHVNTPEMQQEKKENTPQAQNEISTQPVVDENAVEPLEAGKLYPLTSSDIKNLPFGTWWTLFWIPLGIGAIIFQTNLSRYFNEFQRKPKVEKPLDLLNKGLNAPKGSPEQLAFIHQAFIQSLCEKGYISSSKIAESDLPPEGITGKVRQFLIELEASRYGGKSEGSEKELLTQTRALFEEINKEASP